MAPEPQDDRPQPEAIVLKCAPDMIWTVVSDGIWVGHLDGSEGEVLRYPAAAVWDMLGRGRSLAHAAEVLSVLGNMGRPDAETFVRRQILTWLYRARLVREKVDG